jgi:hypothetical protein
MLLVDRRRVRVQLMIILKEHGLRLFAQLDVVLGLILHFQVDDLDLVGPHPIEVLHLNQKFFRNVCFEEVIDQFPKMEVILHFFS